MAHPRAGLAGAFPVAGMLELVEAQFEEMYQNWLEQGMELSRRFAELIDATPSLQTAQRDMSDRLERTAAEALAARTGVSPDDPEPRIAAASLVAMWRIYYDAIAGAASRTGVPTRHDFGNRGATAGGTRRRVWAVVVRHPHGGGGSRQQFKAAGDAAQLAGRQVVAAIRQARAAWEQLQREGGRAGPSATRWRGCRPS